MVLTTETAAQIVGLVEDRKSQRYVARTLGLQETTVRGETDRFERRPGQPRATVPANDRLCNHVPHGAARYHASK